MKMLFQSAVAVAILFTAACRREAPPEIGESTQRESHNDTTAFVSNGSKGKFFAPSDPQVAVAPPPRLAFIFQSEFPGRVIEIGKDSITVQGFYAALSGGWPESTDRRNGRVTSRSSTPGKPFDVYLSPLGPRHALRCESKPLNNGIDSGPGLILPATEVVWTREVMTITHPDGNVSVLRRADEPPRTFKVEWSYTRGVTLDGLRTPDTYRPSDLQVGDEVSLKFRHDLDNDAPNIVHGIRIERRPSGKIPLPPGGRPREAADYRDRMQALQDHEEKGTPIPIRFLPSDERLDHIAPEPRSIR